MIREREVTTMHRLQSFQLLCILLVVGTGYIVEITGEFVICRDLGGECRRYCSGAIIRRAFCPGGEVCCLTVERKCYKCEGATCIYSSRSIDECYGRNLYKSLEECQAHCNDFNCYRCVSGRCKAMHSSSGNCALAGLLTEDECRAQCGPECYKCQYGACVHAHRSIEDCCGDNFYKSLSACESNCNDFHCYKCIAEECKLTHSWTRNCGLAGLLTKEECIAQCGQICFQCEGGACVYAPATTSTGCTGPNHYTSEEECRNHCNSFKCFKCVQGECVPQYVPSANCVMAGLLSQDECFDQCY